MRYCLLFFCFLIVSCSGFSELSVKPGAEQYDTYLPLLKNKRVGIVVNHTSYIGKQHLLDFLLSEGINIERIFCPEHGLRGIADAGEFVSGQTDPVTGLSVVSLYGKNKKPSDYQMRDLDVMVFDLQDVGVRFYTYFSTMHYVMESCSENNVKLIILDRPDPNGDYIDGPVLKPEYRSFVGMEPVPVVHGCTAGEMAMMINGEGWLINGEKCDLTVIPVKNYTHHTFYSLPVKPSPNLPDDTAIRLYPSLCFFESTNISIGRGTHFPFQVIGYPDLKMGDFSFTPESIEGMAKNPKQKGKVCYGEDLRNTGIKSRFSLSYFLKYYKMFPGEKAFFSSENWFNLLAGTDQLLKDIRAGKSVAEIRESWQPDLKKYRKIRKKYLLYPE
ncbi:MAG: DUF1343 domain-containing protein [Prolixibacteraceae bacterium]|nr:DUF1343 domain-containing protein [Prolixibacteraceae bacterium]